MHVLVVEDDRDTRTRLLTWLWGWGHMVTTAENGRDAWRMVSQIEFDLVISNWTLQETDGIGLCRLIRQNSTPSYCYVILYTSNPEQLDYITGMDAGVDDIVSSPFDQGRLRLRIRAAERIINLQRELGGQNVHLNNLNEKLEAAYTAIQSDLQAASALQLSLLPKVSDIHPMLYLDWLVLPSSFLAGDSLNYFVMQERYLIFYHLDVAGHGIPSALLSVTLSQLLSPQPGSPMVRFDPQLELKRIVPPVDVISELNRRFQPQGDAYFTMIYGVFDIETRELKFCQAGHPRPLLVAADQTVTTIGEGGFPVGLWPEMTYEETITTLSPGERLVLYSDGILECLNAHGVAYSEDRLKQLLAREAGTPVKDVLKKVKSEIEEWSRGRAFSDDISMLIIESK